MKKVAIFAPILQKFGREMIDGIMDYKFHEASEIWHFPIIDNHANLSREVIEKYQPDGVICPSQNPEMEKILSSLDIPVVNTSEPFPKSILHTVTFDNEQIGRMAAQHLQGLGFKNFAYCGPRNSKISTKRFSGFCAEIGLRSEQLPFIHYQKGDPSQQLEGFSLSANSFSESLKKLPKPMGIFCFSDMLGVEILLNCSELGLRVPEDVAVVSVNNDPVFCRSGEVELSSIDTNAKEVGRLAAAVLDKLMSGKKALPSTTKIAPLHLHVRHSSDLLGIDDMHVANAVRFIRAHIDEYIDVSDIMRRSTISRRNLENRFKKELNMGIYQTIQSERLNKAANLLKETEWSQERICQQSGFPNLQSFHKAFRKKYSMTPAKYRVTV